MKLNIRNSLLYIGYVLVFFYFFIAITNYEINIVHKTLFMTGICLIVFTGLIQMKKNIKLIILIIFFILLITRNFLFYIDFPHYLFDFEFFITVLLIFIVQSKDIESIFKISITLKIIGIVFVVFSFLIGIIDETIMSDNNRYRHSLGFDHPNGLAMLVFSLSLECIYLYKRKRLYLISIFLLINFVIYSLTDSRTAFLSYLIFIIIYLIFIRFKVLFSMITILPLLFIFFVISIGIPFLYKDNEFWVNVNKVLSGRAIMGHHYIEKFGVSAFGTPIMNEFYTTKTVFRPWSSRFLLDSSYMRIFMQFGWVSTLIIFVFLYKKLKYLVSTNQIQIVSIILSILIFGISESYTYHVALMPLLLLVNKRVSIN